MLNIQILLSMVFSKLVETFFSDPLARNIATSWLIIMLGVSLLCFITSEITRNYSQVDKLWSLLPAVYGIIAVCKAPTLRSFVMLTLVIAWGLRLSYNFMRKGGYNIVPWRGEEDYRWKIMRDNPVLKGRLRFGLFNLLFISFYQNFLIMLFCVPFLMAAGNKQAAFNSIDILAATLMAGSVVLEAIADNQLFRFHTSKRSGQADSRYALSLSRGFICEGLWRKIRHPNYLGEQATWISFYLFGVAASGKLINPGIAGAILLMLLFLGSSTLTERISSSKYPAYKEYMKVAGRFFPRIKTLAGN